MAPMERRKVSPEFKRELGIERTVLKRKMDP